MINHNYIMLIFLSVMCVTQWLSSYSACQITSLVPAVYIGDVNGFFWRPYDIHITSPSHSEMDPVPSQSEINHSYFFDHRVLAKTLKYNLCFLSLLCKLLVFI